MGHVPENDGPGVSGTRGPDKHGNRKFKTQHAHYRTEAVTYLYNNSRIFFGNFVASVLALAPPSLPAISCWTQSVGALRCCRTLLLLLLMMMAVVVGHLSSKRTNPSPGNHRLVSL